MKPRALTRWRKERGLSGLAFIAWLEQLHDVWIDSGQLSRWEHGKRFPKPHTVAAVARATGLRVEDLVPERD